MSPDSRLPLWARRLGRGLLASAYLLCVVVAVADVAVPAATISGSLLPVQIIASTVGLAVGGVVGFVAVLVRRWRWEWVAAAVLFFLLLARAVPVIASIHEVPTRLAAAAMMTIAANGLARRALDLWVFAVTTGALARRARQVREA